MNKELEQSLIECLDALGRGESSESVLGRYPQQAEQLRPFLEVATRLNTLQLQPSLEAKTRSQRLFLAEADRLRQQKPRAVWPNRVWRLAASLLLLVLVSAALLPLSAGAMPGSPLYSVKRAAEAFRLATTTDVERRLALNEAAKEARREEVVWLLANGRSANNLTFEGRVTSLGETTWQVAGIPVQLDGQTLIVGQPEIGRQAIVAGRARQGVFLATAITLPEGAAPIPEPTPTAVTPSPTTTPSPTPTVSDTPTATPSPSQTPTVTPPPTWTATAEPTPSETAVAPIPPPVNDNDNSNVNDNSNDNSNDNDNSNGNDNSNDNDNNNDNDDNQNGNDDDDDD
jgi:hypothetical protein